MLIAFAVVALWFSTAAGYVGNHDVRYSIVLVIVAASGLKAYCSNGRARCFWLAFLFVLLVAVLYQGMISPQMQWVAYSLRPLVTSIDVYGNMQMPGPSMLKVEFLADTVKLVFDLILATVAGYIGVTIYDQSQKQSDR